MRFFEFHLSDDYVDQPYGNVDHNAVWEGMRDTTTAHGIPHYNNARGK